MSIRTRRNSKRLLAGVLAGAFALSGVAISTNVSADDDVSAANVTPASDRISGADRYLTSIAVAEEVGVANIKNIVLATGNAFPDGLAAAGLVGLDAAESAVLLTEPTALPGVVEDFLGTPNLAVTTLYVVGGTAAISDAVVDAAVAAIGWTPAQASGAVTRIGGANRFETAANIATTKNTLLGGAGVTCVVLATGENFPDALSAGSLAVNGGVGTTNCPILLNSGATLRAETAAALKALPSVTTVLIVGGTAVIPTAVQTALAADGYTVRRLSGSDRYGTAAAVANFLGTTYGNINMCLAAGPPEAILAVPSPANVTQATACGAVPGGAAPFPTGAGTRYTNVPTGNVGRQAAILVSGTNFPDALSASPLTSGGTPIMLTREALPTATSSWMTGNAGTIANLSVIGGTAAVTPEAMTAAVNAATVATPTLTSTLGLRTTVDQASTTVSAATAAEVSISATPKGAADGAAGNSTKVSIVAQTGTTPTIATSKPTPTTTLYTIGVPVPATPATTTVTVAQLRAAFQQSAAIRAVFTLNVAAGAVLTGDVDQPVGGLTLSGGGVNALVAGVSNVVCTPQAANIVGTFGTTTNSSGLCGNNFQQTWSLWNNAALSGAIWGAIYTANNNTVPRLAQLNGVAGLLPATGVVVWPFAPAAAEYPTVKVAAGGLDAASNPIISNTLEISSSITWIDAPL